jgi:cell volume regulation protein A
VTDGELLLVTGAFLAAGLLAALVAGRLRVPGLLLFLGLGMVVGSDGTGWVDFGKDFEDYELARTIGIIALALILFEGGLSAGFSEVRPVLGTAVSMAVIGTTLTAVIAGFAAAWLFDLTTLEGLLVGSIVAATDGAAIFAVLRGSTLKRRLARALEGEAGLNDPIAILLVLGFIDWIEKPDYGLVDMLGLFAQELAIGGLVGLTVGRLAVLGMGRLRLATAGLYPVASIAVGAIAFGAADTLHGSGFLAIYLAGLLLGDARIPARRTIVTFHDGLGWLAQLGMFFTLGLLVFPGQLGDVAVEGTILALISSAIARPLAVTAATAFGGYRLREQFILGWAGLRGAVPVVLATFPLIAGVPDSLRFFNIVFFAVLVSTVLQGTTFEELARRLGLTTHEAALPTPLADAQTIRRLGAEVVEFPVAPDDAIVGRHVRELGMPREALLNVIVRGDQAVPPRGSTVVLAGDRLHVLVRQEVAIEFRKLLDRWRDGPIGRPPAPPRMPRSSPSIFSTRPWRDADGDPSHPVQVNGIAVVDQLRTRRGEVPGALVRLADGRFAYTGPVLAVGSPYQLQTSASRRLASSTVEAERAWWREVIGALAVGH